MSSTRTMAPSNTLPLGPPPPFDAQLAETLKSVLTQIPIPLTPARICESRRLTEVNSLSNADIRRDGAFDVEEITAPGPARAPRIELIICRPTGAPKPHGVIYHIHGGGMVAGNNRTAELAGELDRAEELHLAVVGVNYRLAPEHPDPAPVEDCYAGLEWIAANGAEFGFDLNCVIISGNSAGGGLAAGVALLARDRGGPKLLGQMLQCPMLDDRCDAPSIRQMPDVGVWDGISNKTGWTALLGSQRGTQEVSCYAAPARATDLSRLPTAFIDAGSAEALRDEGVDYATRIWQAGGQAELHVWSGGFHSFDQWAPDAEISRSAKRARVSWLRRLLADASTNSAKSPASQPTGSQ